LDSIAHTVIQNGVKNSKPSICSYRGHPEPVRHYAILDPSLHIWLSLPEPKIPLRVVRLGLFEGFFVNKEFLSESLPRSGCFNQYRGNGACGVSVDDFAQSVKRYRNERIAAMQAGVQK
jgi:hypothetical protein